MSPKKQVVLFVAVTLVLCRFILLGPLRLGMYSRFLNPLPIALAVIFLAQHLLNKKKLHWDRCSKVFLGLNIFVALTLLIHLYFQIPFWHVLIPRLSCVLYFLPFPLALSLMGMAQEETLRLIKRLCYVVVWVGGSVAVLNFSLIYGLKLDPFAIINWIFPQDLTAQYGSSYEFSGHIRMLGFLFNLEHSQISVAAATVFLLARSFSNPPSRPIWTWITVAFGLISFPLHSSIIATLIGHGTALLVTFALAPKGLRLKIMSVIALLVPVLFYVNPEVWGRLQGYLTRWWLFLPEFVPTLRGCVFPQVLWAPFRDAAAGLQCSFKEIHSFSYVPEFGLLPLMPWFCVLLSPIYFLFRWKKLGPLIWPCLALALCFLGGAIHYSGVENWGNNYLFILAIMAMIKASSPVPENGSREKI